MIKKCPKCQSRNVVEIVYGMPTKELYEEAQKGEVMLGGCCIDEDMPRLHCKDCEYEWNYFEANE